MKHTQIELVQFHPRQQYAHDNSKRFNLYMAGRRFGKDIMLMRRVCERISKGSAQAWYAPSYRMMSENFRELGNILAPIVISSWKGERLALKGGAVIDFWSMDNYNASRGRKYKWVTINEAAITPNLLEAWNYVIRPTLADVQGGADFGSTPKGLNGFYTLWAQAGEKADWARFKFSTWDNPYIPPSEIEAMKEGLPERVYKQEVMAEFLEDGSFFQGIDAAAIIERPDKPADHEGHKIIAGLDWALSNDFSVLTIGCVNCNKVVDWWRANQIDFSTQREAIAARLKAWNASVLPERNSIGVPNIEILKQMGVRVLNGADKVAGFMTTGTSKSVLIQRLATAIEHDGLKVPIDYADELRSYEVAFTMGGNPTFSAPSGMHDDRVMSLAFMVVAMYAPPVQIFM